MRAGGDKEKKTFARIPKKKAVQQRTLRGDELARQNRRAPTEPEPPWNKARGARRSQREAGSKPVLEALIWLVVCYLSRYRKLSRCVRSFWRA